MRFHVVTVGTRVPEWVDAGFADYARRLPGGSRLALHTVAAARRGGKRGVESARADEAARLRAATPPRAYRVALDGGGRALSTRELAGRVAEWNRTGAEVAFLVGGPDGLDPELLRAADERWSLSPLTLPHALVRVIVAEQVYRALSILHNRPYHR